MKSQLFKVVTLCMVSMLLFSFSPPKCINIERGKIDDNFEIKIIGENIQNVFSNVSKMHILSHREITPPIIIKPNIFFNLAELGLKENDQTETLAEIKYGNNMYTYDISIYSEKFNKNYYGVLIFRNARTSMQNLPVNSYYNIQIPEDYFTKATGGRISAVYEYYVDKKFGVEKTTWYISFSDAPLNAETEGQLFYQKHD